LPPHRLQSLPATGDSGRPNWRRPVRAVRFRQSLLVRHRCVAASEFKGVPRPLARILPTDLEQLDWKRIAPGIKQINLSEQHRRNGAFKLLHLAPGVVLSAHSHNDRELTYVVQGSYQDEIGRFKAGDIADLDGEVAHQPVVDTDQPCIALIASESPVALFWKLRIRAFIN